MPTSDAHIYFFVDRGTSQFVAELLSLEKFCGLFFRGSVTFRWIDTAKVAETAAELGEAEAAREILSKRTPTVRGNETENNIS